MDRRSQHIRGRPLASWWRNFRDESGAVRMCAVSALAELGPAAKEAEPALVRAFLCEQGPLRTNVADALKAVRSPEEK